MNFKVLGIVLYCVGFAYSLFMQFVSWRSKDNPVPENVRDLYDADKYAQWQQYHKANCGVELVGSIVGFVVYLLIFALDALPHVAISQNVYLAGASVMFFMLTVDAVIAAGQHYVSFMKVDQRYGFNQRTMGTFIVDEVKSWLISAVLNIALLCLFILLCEKLGVWTLLLFTGVLMLIVFGVMVLHPFLSRIFNKFTPLEDGELRDKLTALLEKNGYRVRQIQVMDGSKRDSRANAYFSGYGKTKTIVLYDTLLQTLTTDEIVAVFAHELGHGLHKDTLKTMPVSVAQVVAIVLAIWLTVRTGAIYPDFGFAGVNYGMAYILAFSIELPLLMPLFSLIASSITRRAEYRADAHAVKEGYGPALISALKKLTSDSLDNLAPSPIEVTLTYSHPTLSQRIAAIEAAMR